MIEILNDLPAFCEDCPYVCLTFKERLGSGKVGFTCKHLHHCSMVYKKGCKSGKLGSIKEKILEFLKCPEYETCDWKNCFDCNKSRCIDLNNVDRLMSVIEADAKVESEDK